jgi:hypothetical protein
MERQLHLLSNDEADGRASWRLDTQTRAIGRRGLAQARAALRAARPDDDTPPRPPARLVPQSSTHLRRPERPAA